MSRTKTVWTSGKEPFPKPFTVKYLLQGHSSYLDDEDAAYSISKCAMSVEWVLRIQFGGTVDRVGVTLWNWRFFHSEWWGLYFFHFPFHLLLQLWEVQLCRPALCLSSVASWLSVGPETGSMWVRSLAKSYESLPSWHPPLLPTTPSGTESNVETNFTSSEIVAFSGNFVMGTHDWSVGGKRFFRVCWSCRLQPSHWLYWGFSIVIKETLTLW